MATVSLKSLSKRYAGSDLLAVDTVNLDVEHGEFMVLLGPSGCGKSTTLRMIAGLESISSGDLSIDGKRVNDVPAKDRDIAMVFQSYALYPHMSVFDNLAFGLRRRDVAAGEIDKRVRNVATTLGLADLLKRKPHALSGGQRQRVALGRAIVRDPKVFLFDEPLSNLDAALRVGMRGELIKLHHRLGATMIYVTHDQVEAMTMGDRICIMNGGKVVQIGRPLDVYRDPADMFVASFLGSPPTNLLPGRFNGGHLVVGQAKLPVPRNASAEDVIFGIRPEDIRIDGAAAHAYGEVLAVEPLGAETIVRFRLPDIAQDVLVRGPRSVVAKVGERAPIAFDVVSAHLFDPITTQRIT
ncbi:MAG TPA: sn-glycerol-3-phosphate ABC transporter ATP-binding protein UgpC [Burkholderiaceae bacterium]|nr:sn-glycerol-3-phosphate ABC transporter ATP-binding protein UgpC [Burkholderiaceae bacterium]